MSKVGLLVLFEISVQEISNHSGGKKKPEAHETVNHS